jgi:hypothetical protein
MGLVSFLQSQSPYHYSRTTRRCPVGLTLLYYSLISLHQAGYARLWSSLQGAQFKNQVAISEAQRVKQGERSSMAKTTSALPLRRSARVNIACPVRISGMLPNHVPFVEDAQIVTVSKYGARLKTPIQLHIGMKLTVEPLRGKKSGVFRVVWVGRAGTPRAGEVGVEYATAITDVLGINFPDQNLPLR